MAASDNSHNIDQLILRHAVTNDLWRQTAFPSRFDDGTAKPLSEVHHTLATVLLGCGNMYSLHCSNALTHSSSSVGAGVSGAEMTLPFPGTNFNSIPDQTGT